MFVLGSIGDRHVRGSIGARERDFEAAKKCACPMRVRPMRVRLCKVPRAITSRRCEPARPRCVRKTRLARLLRHANARPPRDRVPDQSK